MKHACTNQAKIQCLISHDCSFRSGNTEYAQGLLEHIDDLGGYMILKRLEFSATSSAPWKRGI